jgi:hypothetical protein
MPNDLAFLPLIACALTAPEPRPALREVYETILRWEKNPDYKLAFEQFLMFMGEAYKSIETTVDRQNLAALENYLARPVRIDLLVEQNDRVLARIPLEGNLANPTISGIKPSGCRIYLETGLVIWEGEIAREDIIHSGQLEAAAKSTEKSGSPVRKIPVPKFSVILQLYPGFDEGSLEIIFNPIKENAS